MGGVRPTVEETVPTDDPRAGKATEWDKGGGGSHRGGGAFADDVAKGGSSGGKGDGCRGRGGRVAIDLMFQFDTNLASWSARKQNIVSR
jgi:hypothetical protein